MSDVLSESRPRSRGRVRCDLCGQRIPEGEQYWRTTFVEGREIWDWRECDPCTHTARYTFEWLDYPYGPIDPDDADEWAGDALRGGARSCDELLTALRFRWRYYHGRPGMVYVSRAALRKCFKPERRP